MDFGGDSVHNNQQLIPADVTSRKLFAASYFDLGLVVSVSATPEPLGLLLMILLIPVGLNNWRVSNTVYPDGPCDSFSPTECGPLTYLFAHLAHNPPTHDFCLSLSSVILEATCWKLPEWKNVLNLAFYQKKICTKKNPLFFIQR